MRILYLQTFKDRFNRQLEYIAKDNKTTAIKFRNDLKNIIDGVRDMPMRCRRSIFLKTRILETLYSKAMSSPIKSTKT